MTNKIFLTIACTVIVNISFAQVASIEISPPSKQMISKDIYGQFAENMSTCIYGGLWDKDHYRKDVVEALKKLQIPNLRWPGGCFADVYHWKDGVGVQRRQGVNSMWGMVRDDNSFGTDEFLKLCKLLGCEPYITCNVGTGSPSEMMDWLEYLNYNDTSALTMLRGKNGRVQPRDVSYWGIGNESWGCGGSMSPEYYSSLYRQYTRFAKSFNGKPLKLVAVGPEADNYNWTDVVMKNISLRRCWGISLHYYAIATDILKVRSNSATEFDEDSYFGSLTATLKMDEFITKHSAIMDKYDPQKKIALVVDEWGVVTDAQPGTNPEMHYQQNSLRDALAAATNLNIFNNHSDRVRMANLAQILNVVQSLILTKGDSMLLTPTYFVFDMYKVHQDAKWLAIKIAAPNYTYDYQNIPAINASASMDSNGVVHISIVNLNPHENIPVQIAMDSLMKKAGKITGEVLTSGRFNDTNTFNQPPKVRLEEFWNFKQKGNMLTVDMPSKSVVMIEIK